MLSHPAASVGAVTDLVPVPAPGPLPLSQRVPVEPHRLSALDDLVRGFLLSKGSAHTRTAYAADLASWLTFCAGLDLDPLTAGIHHADAYLRLLAETGDPRSGRLLAPASIARRASALNGFYRYAIRQRAVVGSPFATVERPRPDDEHATSRLSDPERRKLRQAARADGPRSDALITLLVTNGLRISEALNARIEHLSITDGHRVLRYRRKGNRRTTAPLTADVLVALQACIGERTAGPILITKNGTPLDRVAAWRIIRRLATTAGIADPERICPHSMRATFITKALDEGVPLRDVQDSVGHADPRTTRGYDRNRHHLSRHATYKVAAAMADDYTRADD
jgi:integrase/recombinase XerD